jgi:hypothetical protein
MININKAGSNESDGLLFSKPFTLSTGILGFVRIKKYTYFIQTNIFLDTRNIMDNFFSDVYMLLHRCCYTRSRPKSNRVLSIVYIYFFWTLTPTPQLFNMTSWLNPKNFLFLCGFMSRFLLSGLAFLGQSYGVSTQTYSLTKTAWHMKCAEEETRECL